VLVQTSVMLLGKIVDGDIGMVGPKVCSLMSGRAA
jgi:hypothetical protein